MKKKLPKHAMWFSRFSCRFSDAIFFPICWVLYESSQRFHSPFCFAFFFVHFAHKKSCASLASFTLFREMSAHDGMASLAAGLEASTGVTSLGHGTLSSWLHEKLFFFLLSFGSIHVFDSIKISRKKKSYENVEEAETLRSVFMHQKIFQYISAFK
jgi:hypothetical protein